MIYTFVKLNCNFYNMKTKLFVTLTLALLHLNVLNAEEFNKELSFYSGIFDVIDKEGDDQILFVWLRA